MAPGARELALRTLGGYLHHQAARPVVVLVVLAAAVAVGMETMTSIGGCTMQTARNCSGTWR